MPKIQIKMSQEDTENLRDLLRDFRKNRIGEREFDEYINGVINKTFEMTTKISKLLGDDV